jgi:DNA (cytosine-5)-methyltransferase 1/DNA (cytosine-5)-methyltransferase 3A
MNVLSLFDGKSSGFTACELAGIEVGTYYSAEIDKYAIQVSNAIHPNQTRLGSVTEWRDWDIDWASIDMIFGGFPCQAWSVAGKQLGDKDERGMLFWTMLDIMKHVRHHNPKADFLIENVKMKKEFEEYITYHMENAVGDVNKIMIDSSLVSAHSRKRYYWASFSVTQPIDREIALMDIVERNPDEKFNLSNKLINGFYNKKGGFNGRFNPMNPDLKEKSYCLTARYFKCGATDPYIITGTTDDNLYGVSARKLTPRECFRLQTVPEHYIDKILDCGVSNTQLYKIAGNGWTDEVIAHILRGASGK